MFRVLSRVAIAAALLTAGAAGAIAIPLSAKIAGVQYGSGTGLAGRFYDINISDPVATHAIIYGAVPAGTFRSTTIDYSQGSDTRTVTNFLGVDGASFVGTDPGNLNETVLTFDGFLNVTDDLDAEPGTPGVQLRLAVSSDDGFSLKVGGVQVGSSLARGYGTSNLALEFTSAGLYSFSFLYFENYGQNGLNIASWSPYDQMYKTTAADRFYLNAPAPTPEPAMIGLLGLGVLGAAAVRRRARSQ